MPCTPFNLNGVRGIVCTGRQRTYRCMSCQESGVLTKSTLQCDWKVGGKRKSGKFKTCDRHLCAEHGKEVAPDKHLCPEHQRAYDEWTKRKANS